MSECLTSLQSSDPSQSVNLADPDVQLMLEVQKGNALAFEELMTRYQGRVHALLQNIVGNWQLAEDLTQEVFLRVYRSRNTYQPTALFSTWLYRIVHNLALNALRTKNRHPELLFSGAKTDPKTADNQSNSFSFSELILAQSGLMPTRQIDQKELQDVVRLAIDSLAQRQRIALMLHRFEHLSYQEVAEIMQLTPQAVKSLLCRARLNLKEMLRPYVEEGRCSQ